MSSERLSSVLDCLTDPSIPINQLISRLEDELELGYYDDSTLRRVIKWAKKYRDGDDV